jgi:tRNA/tmRNA/rRNA uracil-C5-methylase (TrmA/RlmC/RlmD family)
LCDAVRTRQLRAETVAAAAVLAAALDRDARGALASVAIGENVAATERAAHLELSQRTALAADALERAAIEAGLAGVSAADPASGRPIAAGTPIVRDPVSAITGGRAASDATLRRHAESFFQGNRFLLGALVTAVADAVPDGGEVLDLYAGVGLFSVSLAAMGRPHVTAVEGDRASGADLRDNARPFESRLRVHVARVETWLASRRGGRPATVIIDPPRTGLSKEAGDALVRLSPGRLVYVSCDPPTLARDARRLLDAGYRMESLRAFDLFPNTPHVETLAVLVR